MNSKSIFVMSLLLVLLILNIFKVSIASSERGRVFQVVHKFAGKERSVTDLLAHDINRHGRNLLTGVDLPLGGDGLLTGTALYYTKIGVGSPSKDHIVQVDTGSDLLWLNCIQCRNCPKKSTLGVNLTLYDPNSSLTVKNVSCTNNFCTLSSTLLVGCLRDRTCGYQIGYGDGSTTTGYFVTDVINFNQVSGDLQLTSSNASVTFGCGVIQTGNLLGEQGAVDGLIGFGNSSTSMISQLASSGVVRKIFGHCLNSKNGGGIFAIGNIVHPTVETTPLVLNKSHYNINLELVKVGNETLEIPKEVLELGTIVDSGSTLGRLSTEIYNSVINKIVSSSVGLKIHNISTFLCFTYDKSVDDAFPVVTFQFQNSLQLSVFPREYLIQADAAENSWCIGWRDGGKLSPNILGDFVLSNKLVLYDLERQVLGWTNYDCSSTIKLKDDESGSVYQVAAQNISPTPKSSPSENAKPTKPSLSGSFVHVEGTKATFFCFLLFVFYCML